MRAKLLLTALAAILLGLTACDFEDWAGHERYHKDFHDSFPMKSGGRLSVETFNGSVEISGWDQEIVDISGTKYGHSPEEADSIKVDTSHTPDSVSIRVVRPSLRSGNTGARFVIKVPRGALLDRVTTSNGAIRTLDGIGPARLKTSNGMIRVQGLRGSLDAQTSNDSIELSDIDGDIKAHTSNGRIRTDRLRGTLDAITSNASIHAKLDQANGTVHLESSNGPIDLSLPANSSSDVRIHTNNDTITLHAPEPLNARISARTSNGSVSSDFELQIQGEFSKNHMEGKIGSGGPLFDLTTSNGSIRLLRM
jgi:DUF4097 and DUF4098 domain-containing protein YvlB